MYTANDYLEAVQNLNINRRGDRRAPHKPLLLLFAIAKLIRGEFESPFQEVEEALSPLLKSYAPPVVGCHQPELPYWHLMERDPGKINLWEVSGAHALPLQAVNFPKMEGLRKTAGHLDSNFAKYLQKDPAYLRIVVTSILEDHFSKTLHDDLLATIGIDIPQAV